MNLKRAFLLAELMVLLVAILMLTGVCAQCFVNLSSRSAEAMADLRSASQSPHESHMQIHVVSTTAPYDFKWLDNSKGQNTL